MKSEVKQFIIFWLKSVLTHVFSGVEEIDTPSYYARTLVDNYVEEKGEDTLIEIIKTYKDIPRIIYVLYQAFPPRKSEEENKAFSMIYIDYPKHCPNNAISSYYNILTFEDYFKNMEVLVKEIKDWCDLGIDHTAFIQDLIIGTVYMEAAQKSNIINLPDAFFLGVFSWEDHPDNNFHIIAETVYCKLVDMEYRSNPQFSEQYMCLKDDDEDEDEEDDGWDEDEDEDDDGDTEEEKVSSEDTIAYCTCCDEEMYLEDHCSFYSARDEEWYCEDCYEDEFPYGEDMWDELEEREQKDFINLFIRTVSSAVGTANTDKFINNIDNNKAWGIVYDLRHKSLNYILASAFDWSDSPEGSDFWISLLSRLHKVYF